MSNYVDEIDEILEQANALPPGKTKVQLSEEAVKIADIHQDIELGFDLRQELIDAATFSGYPEKSLVAFVWCLAQIDQDPQRFEPWQKQLLWKYKWICRALPDFTQISQQQIEQCLSDFAKRCQQAGYSLKSVYGVKHQIAVLMNHREEAIIYHQKWREAEKSDNDDYADCDLHCYVNFLIYLGKDEQAILAAQPILSGQLSDELTLAFTLSTILLPLWRLGELEKAQACHYQSYALIAENAIYVECVAGHIFYLVLTNNLVKGIQLLEKHLEWTQENTTDLQRFSFYQATYFLLKTIKAQGEKTIQLRLPSWFPEFSPQGTYNVSSLTNWFYQQTEDLATKFDQRNGNNYYSLKLTELETLKNTTKSP